MPPPDRTRQCNRFCENEFSILFIVGAMLLPFAPRAFLASCRLTLGRAKESFPGSNPEKQSPSRRSKHACEQMQGGLLRHQPWPALSGGCLLLEWSNRWMLNAHLLARRWPKVQ